jgi:TPP-dependent pyruvate/acetoin dehydrogenase alpha subunit
MSDPADAAQLGALDRIAVHRSMVRLREFEAKVHEIFLLGLVRGTTHLSLGQEAIAAGFAAVMRPDDYTFCTYRGHAHVLSRGASLAQTFGELMGRAGLNGGKGGSMHLTSVEHGAMGSYAIVGAHLPIAAGAAWSAALRGSGQVSVCFFGDGTTNIGAFHEALNIAAVWRLPVVFVCENNLYMEYTPIGSVTAVTNPAADRAAAYGLERIIVDGNDVDAVMAVAQATIERARSGLGPSLIEALTYRHSGHSRADPAKYRPTGELETWLERDPIARSRDRLQSAGVEASVLEAIDGDARAEIEVALQEALELPEPDPSSIERELWADGGSAWRS